MLIDASVRSERSGTVCCETGVIRLRKGINVSLYGEGEREIRGCLLPPALEDVRHKRTNNLLDPTDN